jgi:predicted transcriptional regulator
MPSAWSSTTNQGNETNKLSDIMVSPTRIELLNKLSRSNGGMSDNDIKRELSESLGVERHLAKLLADGIIKKTGDNLYSITEEGISVYKHIQEIASKAQEKKIFSKVNR